MLINEKIEITKDIYDDIIINNNGIVTDEVLDNVFSQSMLCGYGVYCPCAVKDNDGFYIAYKTSKCCD